MSLQKDVTRKQCDEGYIEARASIQNLPAGYDKRASILQAGMLDL